MVFYSAKRKCAGLGAVAPACLIAAVLAAPPAAADVAPARQMISSSPVLWPELPPAAAPSTTAPRITALAAELALYPTVLHVRVSLQVASGDRGAHGLLAGVPERSALLPFEGRPLHALRVLVDGVPVAARREYFHCDFSTPGQQLARAPRPSEPPAAVHPLCPRIVAAAQRQRLEEQRPGADLEEQRPLLSSLEYWWIFQLDAPAGSTLRIDLSYLQRVGRDSEDAGNLDVENMEVPVGYLLPVDWLGAAKSGAARAELRVYGLDELALAPWSLPPTAKQPAHYTWELPGGALARPPVLGVVLKGPWWRLPPRTVAVAPYARAAPASVQLFDRVQRFQRDYDIPSRWQRLTLLSALRERAAAGPGQDPQAHAVASQLLRALRRGHREEGPATAEQQACLDWLTPAGEQPADPGELIDADVLLAPAFLWSKEDDLPSETVLAALFRKHPAKSDSLTLRPSTGASAACRAHRELERGERLLGGLVVAAALLGLGVRLRRRRPSR